MSNDSKQRVVSEDVLTTNEISLDDLEQVVGGRIQLSVETAKGIKTFPDLASCFGWNAKPTAGTE